MRNRPRPAPTCAVIDTNVLAVAEGMHPEASETCMAACISLARMIQGGLVVAIDSEGEILREYIKTLRDSKRSGIGAKLAVALSRRHRDTTVCRTVDLTPIQVPPGSYEEVPQILRDFDVDDQQFIAVACGEGSRPSIYQAVDSEWWDRKKDFLDGGVEVQFLCATDLLA